MKPYGRKTETRKGTGCCPGHDSPRIHKWSGRYRSAASFRLDGKMAKVQNRTRRRKDRHQLHSIFLLKECEDV